MRTKTHPPPIKKQSFLYIYNYESMVGKWIRIYVTLCRALPPFWPITISHAVFPIIDKPSFNSILNTDMLLDVLSQNNCTQLGRQGNVFLCRFLENLCIRSMISVSFAWYYNLRLLDEYNSWVQKVFGSVLPLPSDGCTWIRWIHKIYSSD